MLKTFGLSTGLGLAALLSLQNAQAQDVKTVVAKTHAVYQQMKTLQTTYVTELAQGPQKATRETEVKIVAGQKASINVHQQVSGVVGAQKSSDQRIVDDGANIYAYIPQQNQYIKRPHNPNAILQQISLLYGLPYLTAKGTTAKLLPSVKMDGKSAYVLQITDDKAPDKGKILITIDQATYHIKRNQTIIAGAKGGSATITVKSEIFNAPISPAAFIFTPPKGAKEFVPPPQGAMPGAPGGAMPRPGGPAGAPIPPRPGGKP